MFNAIPTNEMDAGTDPVFSVYAPHYQQNQLIARNITYARARHIADYHGALVYLAANTPMEGGQR